MSCNNVDRMCKTIYKILSVCVIGVLVGCGGANSSNTGSSNTSGNTVVKGPNVTGGNVIPIVVDAGPLPTTNPTANIPYVTITICSPTNITDCRTIDHIIVDTMSTGVRIIASEISPSLNLPTMSNNSGAAIVECMQYADGNAWGPIKTAVVKMGQEQTSNIPIQVIGDPAFSIVPNDCLNTNNTNPGKLENTVADFGGKGIIGINQWLNDCGLYCTQSTSLGFYYACTTAAGCAPSTVTLSQQPTNPVAMFVNDNNGVIVSLPSLNSYPNGAVTVTGTLYFGVDTQTNNAFGTTQIYSVNPNSLYLKTVFGGSTLSGFLDTGSNGYFFQSTITQCPGGSGFYCPGSRLPFSATIRDSGTKNNQVSINFFVNDAWNLFGTNNNAFNDLAGSYKTPLFDWGLPFFFGRKVYIVNENSTVAGTPGPFVAF